MNLKYFIERRNRIAGKYIGQLFNVAANMFQSRYRHLRLFSRPMTVQIEPTNKCNLICKQCFRFDPTSKRNVGIMHFEKFTEIVDQFKHVFEISLIGLGESYLNKDLSRMIDYLGQKRIDVSLTTNGTIWDSAVMDAINTVKKVQIQFSIDAARKEVYKKIRGLDCFDRLIENIQKFMKHKHPDVTVSLGLVVMKDNLSELVDFVILAKQLGITRIHFGDLNGTWLGENREELLIDSFQNLQSVTTAAFLKASELGIDLRYNRYEHVWKRQANLNKCWFLWQYPYVTWDGYVTPCCNIANPEMHNFGNLLKTSFKEIWNSSSYCNFRQSLVSGNPHKLCKSCHLSQ